MTSAPPPPDQGSWLDLPRQWQALGAQWLYWWAQAGPSLATVAAAAVAPPAVDANAAPPSAMRIPAIGAEAFATLQAKYQSRFDALWRGVQDVLATAPGQPPRAIPVVASPPPGDRRFAAPEWDELPFFALLKQGYLLAAEYLAECVALAPVPPPERHRLAFAVRQYVDALAPTNFPTTNPDVVKRALATEGASLAQGLRNLAADARKGRISMTDERAFAVGRNLAVTPGDVIYRNELIELIQYAPTTMRVHRRPLVVVPPCINKYYILDLQPHNSFVRHAVAAGHTVFMISWRNIGPAQGRLTWNDYLEEGVFAAIRVVKAVTKSASVNTLGFCVGGTLLACALAVLAARADRSVASATFLTTMLDFADPGEIGVFVSREFLAAREAALLAGQRVHGRELAGAFASLRANDLVWSYVVGNYLKGETPPPFDLLYWNGDSANLPGPMFAYYLGNMYLANRLREPGALRMAGESIDLGRIAVPAYVFAAHDDHIVPWRSAYRTTDLLGGDVTFALGASGHIAGVVNPPETNRRHYWISDVPGMGADAWLAGARSCPGSWWPHWAAWLDRHAGSMKAARRGTGSDAYPPLEPAPGGYVRAPAG
jgi:polyhydroxyalkanoate synthase subunit PhaC